MVSLKLVLLTASCRWFSVVKYVSMASFLRDGAECGHYALLHVRGIRRWRNLPFNGCQVSCKWCHPKSCESVPRGEHMALLTPAGLHMASIFEWVCLHS